MLYIYGNTYPPADVHTLVLQDLGMGHRYNSILLSQYYRGHIHQYRVDLLSRKLFYCNFPLKSFITSLCFLLSLWFILPFVLTYFYLNILLDSLLARWQVSKIINILSLGIKDFLITYFNHCFKVLSSLLLSQLFCKYLYIVGDCPCHISFYYISFTSYIHIIYFIRDPHTFLLRVLLI